MHIDEAGAVILRDGTPLDSLLDRERRNLSARVHADAEIFELELERLFAKAWIPVAHVSEFRQPGDFVTRAIGLDPVIVTLDDDGRHRVLLNVCTHRGAAVCRAEEGNTQVHRCPFHGWGFGSDGTLVGVPFDRQIYAGTLDKPNLGLRQARVETAVGLVFATWDDDAPSLKEYLGDFRWYLEAMLCRTDNGLEVAGAPQRFVIDCNWKVLTEGFFGDAYHVLTVHQSFADIGVLSHTDTTLRQFEVSHNGHALLCFDFERLGLTGEPAEVLARMTPTGMPPELVDQVQRNLSPEQMALMAKTPPSIAGIFPTASAIFVGAGPASPLGQVVSLRFFVPLSPHRTEMLSFTMVERDATLEFKESVHRSSVQAFGVGGMFEADDVEVWASVQRGVRGAIGRRTLDNYQVLGQPAEHHGRLDYAGRGISSDEQQWLFYERYFDFLEGASMVNNAPLLPSSDSDHVDALLFLIGEAEVADTGDYAAWLEFMATEVEYSMPVRTTRNRVNRDVAPARSFLLKEDRASLTLRVKRLLESDSVWSENPASRVRRFVSNIRVRRADDGLVVGSYLLLLRSRSDRDTYEILSADRRDLLVRDSTGTLRLAAREITIDQSRLGMANLPFPI